MGFDSCQWEVCLQYPTYSVWKLEKDVSLYEAREHKIIARRRGNSSEGFEYVQQDISIKTE